MIDVEHLTDLEIAQRADIKTIRNIARSIGIDVNLLEQYGTYKANYRFP